MHYNDIILGPVITEKASLTGANGKTYVFKVSKKANKYQIKDAIEQAFGVKVVKVNTLNTKFKNRRVGRYMGKTKPFKKAYVTLSEGDSINLV